MHDIDSQISKISGQQNYMEQLSRITGNIEFIDMKMYHEKHTKIVNCDSNINILLRKLALTRPEIETLKNNFEHESTQLNIKDKTFTIIQKKSTKSRKEKPPREVVAQGYKPADLIKTQWFKLIKHIEKDIHKFLSEVFPPNPNAPAQQSIEQHTFADLQAEYTQHPELDRKSVV